MIVLDPDTDLGQLVRRLRTQAGITGADLGRRLYISRSGQDKRERTRSMNSGPLIDTARALGFAVALLPLDRPGRRDTGTGWPA